MTLAQPEAPQSTEDKPIGARALILPPESDLVWLDRGVRLRQSPEARAAVIAIVDVRVQVQITQTVDRWHQVTYAGIRGWVEPRNETERGRSRSLSTAPDPRRLAVARRLLGLASSEPRAFGQFSLLTDVTDSKLLAFLRKVAERLPADYFLRFGLDPGSTGAEAVVIFGTENAYREFTRATEEPIARAFGHSSEGLAAVFVGDQTRKEVAAILVHELTHLLNRRVFRANTAPWIEEGTSNDLAYCQIASGTGRLRLGSLGGNSVVIERPKYFAGGQDRVDREIRLTGPIAALSLLRQDRSRQSMQELLALSPEQFMAPEKLRQRYDQSTFVVRFLLDGSSPGTADRFRQYLLESSNGGLLEPGAELAHYLGLEWRELDRQFRDWLGTLHLPR